KMLEALLADSGQDLFSFGPSAITASNVASSVSDSGQVHKLNGEAGPDYFVLGTGRLEIYDDHAVFMPSDGREPLRVSESEIASQGTVLSPEEVQTALQQMQNLSRNRLTAAQMASIKSLLESQPTM